MKRVLICAAAVAFTAAACGGDDADSAGGAGNGGQATPASVAEEIGCSGFKPDETEELFVLEQGECTLNGDDVVINTFSNNDARDNWVEAARQFGGPFFVGDGFVAYSDGNPDTTESLSENLDGEVVR